VQGRATESKPQRQLKKMKRKGYEISGQKNTGPGPEAAAQAPPPVPQAFRSGPDAHESFRERKDGSYRVLFLEPRRCLSQGRPPFCRLLNRRMAAVLRPAHGAITICVKSSLFRRGIYGAMQFDSDSSNGRQPDMANQSTKRPFCGLCCSRV